MNIEPVIPTIKNSPEARPSTPHPVRSIGTARRPSAGWSTSQCSKAATTPRPTTWLEHVADQDYARATQA